MFLLNRVYSLKGEVTKARAESAETKALLIYKKERMDELIAKVERIDTAVDKMAIQLAELATKISTLKSS